MRVKLKKINASKLDNDMNEAIERITLVTMAITVQKFVIPKWRFLIV